MNDEQHQDIGELRPQYQTYDRQKCFIAYSEQAYWSADLLDACEQVLSKPEFNLEPDYARKHFDPNVSLREKALELIANARYGIYDLSCWRADDKSPWQMPRNVFIELGIAIALNRPTLLLRHASNKEAGLELPNCLQCLGEQILEFSGKHSLERVLLKNLPKWVKAAPEQAWWNHHCIFGDRVCEHLNAHPGAKQLEQNTLNCIIADGADSSRPDFREIVEDVLGRFSDVTYTYLDALSLEKGYSFLLCTHCQKVRSSPFAIHRITLKTPPEAFIAIGMSLALETQFEYKISKILITEDIQNVPSLLSGYKVVVAKSDKEKKDSLRKFMPTVIKKVRETKCKPRPLPFVDISVNITSEDKIKETVNSETNIQQTNQKLNLNAFTYEELINLLIPLMSSESQRRGYLIRSLGINLHIDFNASPRIFVTELIRLLLEFGEVQRGKQALLALLEVVREDVGEDRRLTIDNIKSKIESISPSNQNSSSSEDDKTSSSNRGIAATKEGLEKLKAVRERIRFTYEELAEKTLMSGKTVKRFFKGENIDRNSFYNLCNELGLKWEEIAEKEEKIEEEIEEIDKVQSIRKSNLLQVSNDKPIIVGGIAVISFEDEDEDEDGNVISKTVEITPDDLDWEVSDVDERQMGTEIAYAATYYFDRGEITWTVWEYPVGVTNYSDHRIEGATLVKDFDSLEVNNEEPDNNEELY